jgi:hypothetical protein
MAEDFGPWTTEIYYQYFHDPSAYAEEAILEAQSSLKSRRGQSSKEECRALELDAAHWLHKAYDALVFSDEFTRAWRAGMEADKQRLLKETSDAS